jgi:ceramide glucosyltransferase
MVTAALLLLCSAVAVLIKLVGCASALWYRAVRFPALRGRMAADFRPHVRIFMACKGIEEGLDTNLESIIAQDYPAFDLVCCTESGDDPAVAVIDEMRRRYPDRIELVVAGPASASSQKNHNLLASIGEHPNAEVYLFCDAKIRPAADWLERMVEPLSLPRIVGVTASCSSARYSHWHLPHLLQSLLAGWQTVALLGFVGGMWGASMAFRRSDFERLEIARLWSTSLCDDTALFNRLLREGRGSMLTAIDASARAGYSIDSLREAWAWAVRQCCFVRYCLPRYWLPMVAVSGVGAATMLWPFALAVVSANSIWWRAALIGSGLAILSSALNAAAKALSASPVPWIRFLMVVPLWDLLWFSLTAAAGLRRTVAWRGIRYRIDRRGRVFSVERNPAPRG